MLGKQYTELKAWCDKLQEAKDWLVVQLENKSSECEKLKNELYGYQMERKDKRI